MTETYPPAEVVPDETKQEAGRSATLRVSARTIIFIFHPLLLATYCVFMLLLGNNLMSILPDNFRYYVLTVVDIT